MAKYEKLQYNRLQQKIKTIYSSLHIGKFRVTGINNKTMLEMTVYQHIRRKPD